MQRAMELTRNMKTGGAQAPPVFAFVALLSCCEVMLQANTKVGETIPFGVIFTTNAVACDIAKPLAITEHSAIARDFVLAL